MAPVPPQRRVRAMIRKLTRLWLRPSDSPTVKTHRGTLWADGGCRGDQELIVIPAVHFKSELSAMTPRDAIEILARDHMCTGPMCGCCQAIRTLVTKLFPVERVA